MVLGLLELVLELDLRLRRLIKVVQLEVLRFLKLGLLGHSVLVPG